MYSAGSDDQLDDIDLFAAQLVDDGFNAGSALADARADRIDRVIGGIDRHLGAVSRLARDGLDLHNAGLDLRHFHLKEALDQPCVACGKP